MPASSICERLFFLLFLFFNGIDMQDVAHESGVWSTSSHDRVTI